MEEITQESNSPEIEVSPTEAQAREQGWVPKEDFNGEEHKWVDAGEFLRRGELFGKIESQNKELRAIRETLAEFKNHHSKVQENAYKQAIADLKAKKREALVEGDADLVIEVDEQLADVKQQQQQIVQQAKGPAPQELHPEFVAFKDKNSWYDQTPSMRRWADGRGEELAGDGKSPSEVLRTIEREVRQRFPERFENPNRNKAGAVEATTTRSGKPAANQYAPNETERTLAKKFVKQGLFKNEQEYYAELGGMNS
jgi:hypothetical protein